MPALYNSIIAGLFPAEFASEGITPLSVSEQSLHVRKK